MYSFSFLVLFCSYIMGNHCIATGTEVEMWSQRWLPNRFVAQGQSPPPSPGPGDPPWPGLAHLSRARSCTSLPSTYSTLWTCSVLCCTYAQTDPCVPNILCFSSPDFLRQMGGDFSLRKDFLCDAGLEPLCEHCRHPSIIDLPHGIISCWFVHFTTSSTLKTGFISVSGSADAH